MESLEHVVRSGHSKTGSRSKGSDWPVACRQSSRSLVRQRRYRMLLRTHACYTTNTRRRDRNEKLVL